MRSTTATNRATNRSDDQECRGADDGQNSSHHADVNRSLGRAQIEGSVLLWETIDEKIHRFMFAIRRDPGRVQCCVVRGFIFLFLSAVFVARASGEQDTFDPAFEKIPFDHWLGEHEQAPFRWTASVPRAELSFHQRLMARVEIKLDGRDLEARRSDGQLMFFVQITDSAGARYQNHSHIELNKLDPNIKNAYLEYSQSAFFLPGDFGLAVVILDTATGEHGARQIQFRVASPQHDLLPGVWRGEPPVEFVGNQESPDSWYLPDVRGRLQWAASVHSQARVNVILKLAVSVAARGSRSAPSGDLAALLPTLKAISQTGSKSVSEHVELLDLARRRAVFKQDEVHDLDWPRLKTSLGEANTASIDIHSLSERHHDAQFFVAQVRSLLRTSEQPCVLIVLTAPVAFESGEDLTPISLEGLTACRVVYIRYRAPAPVVPYGSQFGGRGRGSRMGGPATRNRPSQDVVDQLEATLKPLNPKIFDVSTPEQMTRALADIEKALVTYIRP